MGKTLVSLAVIAAPVAAQSAFSTPELLCFADGAATYRLAPAAGLPDIRIRFDNQTPRPDLRMQLVDRPEIADFVLVDDYGGRPSTACRSSLPVKTVKVDAAAKSPDVTVALSADVTAPHYRVYVHSVRFSHQDAAAFLAAMWKVAQRRERTATANLDR
jgi:hypothetical protein